MQRFVGKFQATLKIFGKDVWNFISICILILNSV
jgi:hypothetical protein